LGIKNRFLRSGSEFCRSRGYIAVTSALIISLLIMAVIFAVSLAGFYNRANISNSEYKEISNALAEGCVESALLDIATMSTYAGNETVLIGDKQCNIFPIETAGGQKIIKAKAVFQNAVTNLKITVNSLDLSIVSWEEIPVL